MAERVTRVGLVSRPFEDTYHVLLTMGWGRFYGLLVALFLVANALFASAYYLNSGGVENAHGYLDYFFFSVQTMATIGYGKMTPHSVFANCLVTAEALMGMLMMAMATGLTFAKFSRPTARVSFSRNMLVDMRDGKPTLTLRMANSRANQIMEAQVRLAFLAGATTQEGEKYRKAVELKLVRERTAVFALSWTVLHIIDETSPLWGMDAAALAAVEAEFMISLMGTDETFAQTVSARHLYYADEVVWHARFADIMTRFPDGRVLLDHGKFHDYVAHKPGP